MRLSRRFCAIRICASRRTRATSPPANFFIVTVPTPIDAARRPDLSARCSRRRETVGEALKRGDIVVYEIDRLSRRDARRTACRCWSSASGLICGQRFHRRLFARAHQSRRQGAPVRDHHQGRLRRRMRRRSTSWPTSTVRWSPPAFTARPRSSVAEAAKVIENTQRDLNIAFMNELSLIFHELGIDTGDVLAAARTKWNFLPFHARSGRRPLHRRRSLLPDLSRREGRLSSRGHPRGPAHQRRRSVNAWRANACGGCWLPDALHRRGDGARA